MSTFSQVVDELVTEHLRPDLRTSIAAYLNATIREVHMREQGGTPIYYESNRLEDTGTIAALPALWDIPSVPRFQVLETLFFPDYGEYAKKRAPARVHLTQFNGSPFYWYRTGSAIAMSGILVGQDFNISWFEFPKTLLYYVSGQRPMTWSEETELPTYHTVGATDYNLNAASRALADSLTTNWLILRWKEMLKQGVRNKIFVRLGEETRARASYSIYSGLRGQCMASESMEMNPQSGEN